MLFLFVLQVSEIKRANNIITDQDLYALSFIKIPVNRLRKELNFDQDRHLFITESENSTNVDCDDFDDRRFFFQILKVLLMFLFLGFLII